MLPIRHRSIFKSRWIALLWAAGICWTAYDVATSPIAGGKGADGDDAGLNAQQMNAVDAAFAKVGG